MKKRDVGGLSGLRVGGIAPPHALWGAAVTMMLISRREKVVENFSFREEVYRKTVNMPLKYG